LEVIQKSSIIIFTITYTKISKSKAIDDVSHHGGIYKLSHSWVNVTTAATTNNLKCDLKGILVTVLHTSWTAIISTSHPFCDGGGERKAGLLSLRKIKLFIPTLASVQ
jgi:hypothetical protein